MESLCERAEMVAKLPCQSIYYEFNGLRRVFTLRLSSYIHMNTHTHTQTHVWPDNALDLLFILCTNKNNNNANVPSGLFCFSTNTMY